MLHSSQVEQTDLIRAHVLGVIWGRHDNNVYTIQTQSTTVALLLIACTCKWNSIH